jgi:hypothetical protein
MEISPPKRVERRGSGVIQIEHLGLLFGSLAASPSGIVKGHGVPLIQLSFGLLVFPGVWDLLCTMARAVARLLYQVGRRHADGCESPHSGRSRMDPLAPVAFEKRQAERRADRPGGNRVRGAPLE